MYGRELSELGVSEWMYEMAVVEKCDCAGVSPNESQLEVSEWMYEMVAAGVSPNVRM